jgi:hypothetical protein
MEVINSKQFEVVFTFVKHAHFGVVIEANAVQLLENGKPSLTYQRIREKNSDYFGLDERQNAAVQLIETFEVESIMAKFYTGTKKLRPADFLLKQFTPEMKIQVRAFIERQLVHILNIVKDYHIYWSSVTGEPMGSPISFVNEPASVLFHFRRDETGMNYFATVKHQDEKVRFFENESVMLVNKPAWMLTDTKLLFFNDRVDGQKIKPFLTKKFIHIEPAQEAVYMQKFVLPLLENHDVYALGFDIVTEQLDVQPVLRLSKVWDKDSHIVLYFKYGSWLFPYHVNKRVNVSLEEKDGKFTFHRIRRSYQIENEKISILKELGLEVNEGSLFSVPMEDTAYSLIQWINEHTEDLQRKGFKVEQDFTEVNYYLGKIELKIKVNQFEDWFDVMAVVKFGEFEIPFSRLKNNILQKKKEFVLPDGSIAILPDEWFARFSQIVNLADFDDKTLRLKNIHVGLLDNIQDFFEEELPKTKWNEVLSTDLPDYELPSDFVAELREYQKEGYNWIKFLLENKLGALLADDMGLGKTIQTLAVIQSMINHEYHPTTVHRQMAFDEVEKVLNGTSIIPPNQFYHGPTLVICPKSLLYNWQSEANKFCPTLKVMKYNGIHRHKLISEFADMDLVIMSYGTMRNDIEILKCFEYRCIVLDESQAIKNPSSLTARNLLKLNARNRIALTGTPIENTLLDIWSQMNFLNPGLLGSYSFFENQFIKPIEKSSNAKKAEELRKFIDPFVLRRTKSQVVKELPPKVEKNSLL